MFDKPLMIFDCDGVLIDSEAIYLEEEFAFLAGKGVHVDKVHYVGEFMALTQPVWRAKYSKLIEDQTGTPLSDAEYTTMIETVRKRILNEVTPINGVEAMLSALKTKSCVASSTQMKFLPGKLERTKLASFFNGSVYSGDMVENGKPAPDLFLHAAQDMGDTADGCIVIEDSANGVRGGKAAGMFTIGFTGGAHCFDGHGKTLEAAGADIVLASHAALTDWLADHTRALA